MKIVLDKHELTTAVQLYFNSLGFDASDIKISTSGDTTVTLNLSKPVNAPESSSKPQEEPVSTNDTTQVSEEPTEAVEAHTDDENKDNSFSIFG